MFSFVSEGYRVQVAATVSMLKPLCEQEQQEQLDNILADAIEDVRTGRIDAEIENSRRDLQRKAEAAAKQNDDDSKRADGDL